MRVNLIEISVKNENIMHKEQIINYETKKLIEHIPKNNLIIVLDEKGQSWSTIQLAKKINKWINEKQDISFLIGGPNGIETDLIDNKVIWSLSTLTFPYQLVKIIVIEQLYRAWTIINNHPYHRN